MSQEIVTINRAEYDKLVANSNAMRKLQEKVLMLLLAIEAIGYEQKSECGPVKEITLIKKQ